MKVYFDNVIVCGRVRRDLEPKEMAAVDKIAAAEQDPHFLDRKSGLKPFCGKLLICKPSELVNELKL